MYRGMPPSAGACQTIEALLKPDCGRAGDRSSIMTAITCRAAASGVTSSPVSGAGTRLGGAGVDGGGSVGGTADGLGPGAMSVGEGAAAVEEPGALVAATAPPGKSVPICDATRIPRAAMATPMSPISPRRSVFGGALDCPTLPPATPTSPARRIADLCADTR